MDHGSFDYIIVGAGSAGCLLANRLTENPDISVLLVEAGAKDDYLWIHIPVGYLYCIDNPRTDWRYRTQPVNGLNGRSLLYPRGKVLGGSSSINGMIYMRGQEADYQSWVDATGDAGWSWSESLKRYKKFEDYYGGSNEWHSSGGAWRVEKQRLSWKILDVFREAAVQAGVPRSDDFNRGNNLGVGYFDVNQNKGWRLNTARAFLKPAARRENLTLITGAEVDRLHFDSNKKCTSISFSGAGKTHTAQVKKEVLLCAGSIGSVAILERSGIGQSERLNKLGIPVISDLPGVGENFQDHLQLRMIYQVSNIPTLNKKANTLLGKAMIGLEYLFKRSGPMSMAPSQLGAFAMSSPDQTRPNIQYHVQPLSLDKFGEPLHTFNAFTASVCNLRPSSRGSVHIVSADPKEPPAISPNYLSTPEDKRVAIEAIQFTRKIVESDALKPYEPKEYKPGAHLNRDDELVEAAGNIGTTIFHPVGTCKMGRDDDPMAVLDPSLNVRGVFGLRVVDASAMPNITSGNTAAPTMLIAYRAADLIQNSSKH
jgi:choline dehydrogenase